MKKLILLLLAVAGGSALAQTNVPPKSPVPHQPTEISSDSADFDLNIRRAVYRGHVSVVDPKVKMQCELLVVDLPMKGEHLQHVSAETWTCVAVLSMLCTAGAFLVFFELIKEVGATRSVVVTYFNTAIAVVLGVIGYRVFKSGGSAPALSDAVAQLPAGARIVSTAVGDNRIVLTVEVGGSLELHIFDLNSLKPVGRMRFAPAP